MRRATPDDRGVVLQTDKSNTHPRFVDRRAGQHRGLAERNELVLQFMPLARRIAREYYSPRHREDVEQVAYLALVKAIDRFDPTHGNAFVTYAAPTIAGEIKKYFRDYSWDIHVPRRLQDRALRARRIRSELAASLGRTPRVDEIATRLDADPESVREALSAADARDTKSLDRDFNRGDGEGNGPSIAEVLTRGIEDHGFARVLDRATLRVALKKLSDQERQVLGLRFLCELSQAEIGTRIGVSQMQVSRLLRRALEQVDRPDLGHRGEKPDGQNRRRRISQPNHHSPPALEAFR